jgi:hypothetical protein
MQGVRWRSAMQALALYAAYGAQKAPIKSKSVGQPG